MKIHTVFTLIFLFARKDVFVNCAEDSVKNAPEKGNEENRFDEEGVKWFIDLGDMLNFSKHKPSSRDVGETESPPVKDYEGNGQAPKSIKDQPFGESGGINENGKAIDGIKDEGENVRATEGIKDQDGNGQAIGRINSSNENGQLMRGIKGSGENEQDISESEDPDKFKIRIRQYIIRYVNLFLYLLNLQEENAPDLPNEEVNVNFDFIISRKDLIALRNLSKSLNEDNILDQLYIIDYIISRGLYPKHKFTFFEELKMFFEKSEFGKEWFTTKNTYFFIFGSVALFMVSIKRIAGFSYKFIVLVLVNNMIVLQGIINYWIKLEEATISDHVARLKYKSLPESCNMENQSIFSKIYDLFVENECMAYHRTMHLNKADSIFPLESVINAYTFYLIETPFKIFGSGLRAFTVSVNEYMPVFLRPFTAFITQYVAMGMVFFLSLLLLSPMLRVNAWGANIELGFPQWIRYRTRYREDDDPPEYVRIRELPRSAIREIEKEYIHHPPDYLEEGSDSVSEVVKDTGNMELRQVEENRVEENNDIEIVDEDVNKDNESLVSEERNLSQDIKIAKKLLAELRTSE